MAERIATDEFLCCDEFDVSGISSNFGAKRSIQAREVTCFLPPTGAATDPLYMKRFNGPESMEVQNSGYLDAAINLAAAKAALAARPIVTKGDGRALGDTCYLFLAQPGDFEYGGPVGEVVAFALALRSDGIVVPGTVFEFGLKTATQNGTARALSAVTSTQRLYAHVHVIAVTGTNPTLDIVEESSAIGDFTDAVPHGTYTQITNNPATWKQRVVVAGPITDLNHRFRWTVGGTGSPSFLLRLVLGIR
jgi:hypothetical protein